MSRDLYLGWSDPVGILGRLQTAVKTLAEGRGKFRERMEKATHPLITVRPENFPERIRNRATKVLGIRGKVAKHTGDYTHFAFDQLTLNERKRLAADIIALYDACLIDIGRMWPDWDFVYPKDTRTVA